MTLVPHAWLVEQIGGERVEVRVAVAPGRSPETYQPTDAEASGLLRAGVFFRAGVAAERGAWFEALSRHGRARIVDLRQGVDRLPMQHHHGSHGREPSSGSAGSAADRIDDQADDPHIWLSPRRLKIQARTVAEALAAVDPGSSTLYRRRLAELEARLTTLDEDLRRRLEPHAGRGFLVFHPAWGYFAADYGLRQMAIEIEGKEPSDVELTRIQKQARAEGTKVVFVQPQITGRSARAVAQALGGRVETLDPLAPDVIENLRRSADKIVAALGG